MLGRKARLERSPAAKHRSWVGKAQLKWKVVIVGPTGTAHKDTNAYKLLYPSPTLAEAEAHANCLRIVGMKVALVSSGSRETV